jgi:hypothetical protein
MLYLFLIFICIVLYFQYKFINKTANTIEILQYNNPEKDRFEDMLSDKKPAVFTNILNNINLTKRNIREYFHYYLPPLCLTYKYDIIPGIINHETPILKQFNYRYILYQLKGTKKIILFSPKETKNLYPDISKKQSNVNFWQLDSNVYPNFNNVSYLEIILRPRQMLYIPTGWWFTTKNETKSNTLICTSETVFSRILKKNK